jgi:hypothetical protein
MQRDADRITKLFTRTIRRTVADFVKIGRELTGPGPRRTTMFHLSMPLTFSIGETAPVRINREAATLTWRDADHLVINDDDVRVILTMEEDATLRHFCCGDAGQPAAHYTVTAGREGGVVVSTRPDPDAMTGDYDSNPDDGRLRYWIAVNGASCTRSLVPMRHPQVSPTPVQLLGFLTGEAAHAAQQICLTASLPAVQAFLERLREPVRTGDVRVIQFRQPEPPTPGPPVWQDRSGPRDDDAAPA